MKRLPVRRGSPPRHPGPVPAWAHRLSVGPPSARARFRVQLLSSHTCCPPAHLTVALKTLTTPHAVPWPLRASATCLSSLRVTLGIPADTRLGCRAAKGAAGVARFLSFLFFWETFGAALALGITETSS